jgi:argininosuccinate lyase
MWGGRFEGSQDHYFARLNASFSIDVALFQEEIVASIGWAEALGRADVITVAESQALQNALLEIRKESEGRGFAATDLEEFEDVHTFVEAQLIAKVGELGKKLHTGRSRNDQVATDLRLWLRSAFAESIVLIRTLAAALADRASEHCATPIPGYTHLKRAEPVTFGHWCLAYVEMLLRDAGRLADAAARADECPLGSAALGGTPLPIDRHELAAALGFARPTANSLDAVSDRDAAADYLYAVTLMLVHLSRLSEDLIFFSSDEAGYVELPDAVATGSSRMPQKKNPDLLELTRGHAARSIGEITGLLSLLKGLPLAYDKDLQLDKEPLFRSRQLLGLLLPALTRLINGLQLNQERLRHAAGSDLVLATELADALARAGVPFREAHDMVGGLVHQALGSGTPLREVAATLEATREITASLDLDTALAARDSWGGTAPQRVAAAAEEAKQRIRSLG